MNTGLKIFSELFQNHSWLDLRDFHWGLIAFMLYLVSDFFIIKPLEELPLRRNSVIIDYLFVHNGKYFIWYEPLIFFTLFFAEHIYCENQRTAVNNTSKTSGNITKWRWFSTNSSWGTDVYSALTEKKTLIDMCILYILYIQYFWYFRLTLATMKIFLLYGFVSKGQLFLKCIRLHFRYKSTSE